MSSLFKNYLESECGLAYNTVSAYLSDVKLFSATCASLTFTANDVSTFIARNPASSATVARRLASLKAYARFLRLTDQRSDDIKTFCDRLEAPKKAQRLPNVLGRGQVVDLIRGSLSSDDWKRDSAIVEVLYSCGLRASELLSLTVESVDFVGGSVRVLGKGSKERVVPMGRAARESIERHLAGRCEGVIFSGLDRFKLVRIIKRARAAAGLAREVTPHTLRHTFASHLLSGHDAVEIVNGVVTVHLNAGGADIRHIQEMMGHSDVATTAGYLHTDMAHLKRIHAKLGR